MSAEHLEILVEERSTEVFLRELLPRLIGGHATFNVYPSLGKDDLLRHLPARLKGYASWLPKQWRIVVVVDRDDQDCYELKEILESAATEAGLSTRTRNPAKWQVANRLAIEELEAWYFGDWDAVRAVYPKVPKTLAEKAAYRDPDEIRGGTWEAFERVLQRAGYFPSGLLKTEVARALGTRIDPERNRSRSFQVLCETLLEAVR